MTDALTSKEAVRRHLDLSHNHEAGLIPMATQILLEDVASENEEFLGDIARANTERDAALAENASLREALEWYGEQARLARLIHSEGDIGRHALAADGGKRAISALFPESLQERAARTVAERAERYVTALSPDNEGGE
mgnify:CR=1 FL=1